MFLVFPCRFAMKCIYNFSVNIGSGFVSKIKKTESRDTTEGNKLITKIVYKLYFQIYFLQINSSRICRQVRSQSDHRSYPYE